MSVQNLAVYLLRSPKIELNNVEVVLPTTKCLGLVAFLVVSEGRHRRERLASMFWPELDLRRGMAALRTTVWRINKALPGLLDSQRSTISISDTTNVWVDSRQFVNLITSVRIHNHQQNGLESFSYPGNLTKEKIVCANCLPVLEEAINLNRSGFMEGFPSLESRAFEEWQVSVASWHHVLLLDALDRLVSGYAALGNFETAISYALIQYQSNKYSEDYLRKVMWLHLLSGNRQAAARLYEEYEGLVRENGSFEPEPETVELVNRISNTTVRPGLIQRTPVLSAGFVAVEPPAWEIPHSTIVPAQLTPFIGREKELQEIIALLDSPACRLLTLLGPGGVGKTRLALQVAYQLSAAGKSKFPDGVYLIPFSCVDSSQTLKQIIEKALNFSFHGEEHPITQIFRWLRNKKLLLILENTENSQIGYEHLLGALETAPGLKVINTSRERLNVRGEWIYLVPGLPYPGNDAPLATGQYDAVNLFIQIAQQANPQYKLNKEDEPYIRKICQLLDGLPLGIELAAAWTRSLPLKDIAEEVDHNLDFLTASHHDYPPRQKSLRASFDYSWQMLGKTEQNILKKLSVFRGGFTRENAALVADVSPRMLSLFIDKSIIRRTQPNRYRMIELFRRYVEEKLDREPSARRKLYDDHCREFAVFLQARTNTLYGLGQEAALAEIDEEIDNIICAWNWAVKQCRVEELDKMLEALNNYFLIRGRYQAAYEAFSSAVNAVDDPSIPYNLLPPGKTRLIVKLLSRQGQLAVRLHYYKAARESLTRSLAIVQHFKLQHQLGFCLYALGTLERALGAYQEARRLVDEGLKTCQRNEDHWGAGLCLVARGSLAQSPEEGKAYYQKAFDIFEQLGDRRMCAASLINMSDACLNMGEYQQAQELATAGLEISRKLNASYYIAIALMNLGESEAMLGEHRKAKIRFQEWLELYTEGFTDGEIAMCEVFIGNCAIKLKEYPEAFKYLLNALERMLHLPDTPEMLHILTSIAALYVELRKYKQALEIARVVVNYESAWKKTLMSANEVISTCSSVCPTGEIKQVDNVEQVVQRLYKSMKLDSLIHL